MAPLPLILAAALLATPVLAQQAPTGPEPRGPALSAASNLSQGRRDGVIERARSLGVARLRDGMNWGRAEPAPGIRDFDDHRTGYPEELGARGIASTVVLNWGNPLYDDGDTPHGTEALAAFGALARAIVERFPSVEALEIGNEFNGVNFVRGPLREMAPLDRARAYVPMLRAASEAARAARPDVRILGGATHSLPVGYLWEVLDAGGAGFMDALAVHPYTTPAEQLVRQVGVLRRHPDATPLPIEVTEFGHPDPRRAAGHFLRNYCQMALSGVTVAVWYPLNERGDDMVPLFDRMGRITPAGRAWRLIAERMEGRAVADAAPDPFSYGCRFGDDVLVLWGEPRSLEVASGTLVLDAEGAPVPAPHALDPEAPLVLVRGDVAGAVRMHEVALMADSMHQFAFPSGTEARAGGDAFERFARRDGEEHPLLTLPGQERGGVPWFPYRGNPDLGRVRLTHGTLLPGGRAGRETEIVHRWTAPEDGPVLLEAHFDVPDRSADGVRLRAMLNGAPLAERAGKGRLTLAERLDLSADDVLELAVGPNGNADGDLIGYRIVLRRP